jgi:hypothetical protein
MTHLSSVMSASNGNRGKPHERLPRKDSGTLRFLLHGQFSRLYATRATANNHNFFSLEVGVIQFARVINL